MKVRNSQKGFVLVEVLVAIAVGGMVLGGIVSAIFQTTNITTRTPPQVTALEDIKYATYWISKDVRMAATTNLVDGAPPVNNLVLDWTSWYDDNGQLSAVSHHCEYALSGRQLCRTYDSDPLRAVGRYVSNIEFSRQGQIILITITSSPDGKAETAEKQTYHMYLQPKENPVQ